MKASALAASLATMAPCALAWGVVGHEAIATIAQIHLHPSARAAVAAILPKYTKGHLAPVAAWADRVRYLYHWSGPLHYITPNDDHPNDTCIFDHGFKDEEHNVVKAIGNYTQRVAEGGEDYDLRFLTHYVGDVHQPLHLTGRERGGNGDHIRFEGRKMSLHGLWDTQLISRSVRELHNYSRPTNSYQIESNLRGTVYDPYIRWILLEGVARWWRDDLESWLECPSAVSGQLSSDVPQLPLTEDGSGPKKTGATLVCPHHWASEVHKITCIYPFPDGYDPQAPPPELGGREYYGRIRNDKVIEALLAKGGLRLAALLNGLFASEEELAGVGLLNLDWEAGAEPGPERVWWRPQWW